MSSPSVRFLYGTSIGRSILKLIQIFRLERIIVAFLRSRYSKPIINTYTQKYGIPKNELNNHHFNSFADFFTRKRDNILIDMEASHLISPCDGYMSAYPISSNSSFFIKGSCYRLYDLLHAPKICKKYLGGDCLIFRLSPNDYHRYCYIDNGSHGKNHFIPGILHSVQPIACEKYPVYTMNRRMWTALFTENFGNVIQIEVGALVVGGIHNYYENFHFSKGIEMGHFDISGSTIILLFEKDKMHLLPEISEKLCGGSEVKVKQGQWIGISEKV